MRRRRRPPPRRACGPPPTAAPGPASARALNARPLCAAARGSARRRPPACAAPGPAPSPGAHLPALLGRTPQDRGQGGGDLRWVIDDEARVALDADRLGRAAESPAITGRPARAASAKTMPKPSTSRPPQRLRHGEANTSAARSHSLQSPIEAAREVRAARPRFWARSFSLVARRPSPMMGKMHAETRCAARAGASMSMSWPPRGRGAATPRAVRRCGAARAGLSLVVAGGHEASTGSGGRSSTSAHTRPPVCLRAASAVYLHSR